VENCCILGAEKCTEPALQAKKEVPKLVLTLESHTAKQGGRGGVTLISSE